MSVTASFGDSPDVVYTVLRSARVVNTAFSMSRIPGASGPAGADADAAILAATVVPGTFTGQGFDACTAPSSSAMQAWLSSPYRGVGVYIGGVNRACAQPNLTSDWVATQVSRG